MGCIVMEDCLYVVGGTNRHNEVLQSVERYCVMYYSEYKKLGVLGQWLHSVEEVSINTD